MSNSISSQVSEIKKTGINGIKSTASAFGFGWIMLIGLNLILTKDNNCWIWWEGLVVVGISLIPIACCFFCARYIRGAVAYQFLAFLSTNLPSQVLFWLFVSKLLERTIKSELIIAVNTTILICFIVFQTLIEYRVWKKSTVYLIETGRLNREKAIWDLTKQLRRASEKEMNRSIVRIKRLMRLTYLIPGIGMMLARNLSRDFSLLMVCVLMDMILFIMSALNSQSIGLILFLNNIGREQGRKVTLAND